MDLDSYRRSAEAFVSEREEEFYLHYGGHKEGYEIEGIYDRHADLFDRASVESVRELASVAASDDRRQLEILLDFAIEGLIGQATKELEGELARREAALSIELDGRRIGFRESSVVQANEPDAERRAEIEAARRALIEDELNPLYRELVERQHASAAELGYTSYRAMCASIKGIDLERLGGQTAAFEERTRASYPGLVDPEFRRTVGLGLDQVRRSDFARFFRAAGVDSMFPRDRLVESLAETVRGLGMDISAQPGVMLDVESRPGKSPRAFCAPVRAPGEVHLVIAPIGGRDDYESLLHEGGHTEHFANMSPGLPFEYRLLGDNAITECFAFLFQYLVDEPAWLRTYLGIDEAQALAAHARAVRLIYLRRYTGKLAYELRLHGSASLDGMRARYGELLGGALMVPWSPETYLSDVDPAFYCAAYLRAWALEAHLRRHLEERFGPEWFSTAEAGEVLRELWGQGQRLRAEEMLAELTGEELDFASLAAEFAG